MSVLCLLAAAGGSVDALDLSSSPADLQLVELLWARSPDLVAARAKLGQAEAEVTRSEVFQNPGFDFQWGTLALGPTNPPGLDNQPFEIGKRGPRQAASRSARDAAVFDTVEFLRQRWFDLLERISEVATAEIRVGALEDTVHDAQRLADLQLERSDTDRVDVRSDNTSLVDLIASRDQGSPRTWSRYEHSRGGNGC
ncbi:MAG TPA: hypothetical protein VGH93_10280 [Solirubrobacteraceae bacterium]